MLSFPLLTTNLLFALLSQQPREVSLFSSFSSYLLLIFKSITVMIALVSVHADSFDGPHPLLSPHQHDTALCQVTFGVADVGKLLKQVNPYSVMGPDYTHPRILKESADTPALPLFYLFSDSLSTGLLPAAWKEAQLTPIYKSGDLHSPASYRPISLTSIPWKTLERLKRRQSSLIFRGMS